MSRCHACGQERGESLAAHMADLGHDPLEHCEMLAIYRDIPTAKCVGQAVARQCHLCKVGKSLGTWENKRGNYTFTPKEAS